MATHIHFHGSRGGGKTQRTIDAMAKASREGKKVLLVSKTRDCGCGGSDKKTTDAAMECDKCGNKFQAIHAGVKCPKCGSTETFALVPHPDSKSRDSARPTRDAGEPVNNEWIKLDRMMPDDLARAAGAKNVVASGKTDTIMGILRATFSPQQVESWALYF